MANDGTSSNDPAMVRRLPLLMLLPRWLFPLPGRQRALCDTRLVVAQATRDHCPVRVITRVVRVRLGTDRRPRRRGGPRLAGQLPHHLHCRKRDDPVAAVVAGCIEATHAPQVLRLFHAVGGEALWVGWRAGGRSVYGIHVPGWRGTRVSDRQRMEWGESRKGEKKRTRHGVIHGGSY